MGPKPQLSVNDRKMKVSKGAVNVQGTQGFISFSEVVADATPKSNTSPLYMGTDPELSTVSKKLTKKNEVTILKAFADLEGIFQDRGALVIPDFAAFFVFVYHRLIFENQRNIRERLNVILELQLRIDKTAFGPLRKRLIGAWWMAMSDPCIEVTNAATLAFSSSVLASKRVEVLTNLAPYILLFISDHLAMKPEILSDLSTCTKEEAEERYERVISSCLNALSKLIKELPIETNEQLIHMRNISNDTTDTSVRIYYEDIINETFWKKTTSKRKCVRKGGYEVLSACCSNMPQILLLFSAKISQHHQSNAHSQTGIFRLVTIICNMLGEQEAENITSMLFAFVMFMKIFPVSWNLVQFQKIFTNKIIELIKLFPATVLPMILPIFSTISFPIIAYNADALSRIIPLFQTKDEATIDSKNSKVVASSITSSLPQKISSKEINSQNQLKDQNALQSVLLAEVLIYLIVTGNNYIKNANGPSEAVIDNFWLSETLVQEVMMKSEYQNKLPSLDQIQNIMRSWIAIVAKVIRELVVLLLDNRLLAGEKETLVKLVRTLDSACQNDVSGAGMLFTFWDMLFEELKSLVDAQCDILSLISEYSSEHNNCFNAAIQVCSVLFDIFDCVLKASSIPESSVILYHIIFKFYDLAIQRLTSLVEDVGNMETVRSSLCYLWATTASRSLSFLKLYKYQRHGELASIWLENLVNKRWHQKFAKITSAVTSRLQQTISLEALSRNYTSIIYKTMSNMYDDICDSLFSENEFVACTIVWDCIEVDCIALLTLAASYGFIRNCLIKTNEVARDDKCLYVQESIQKYFQTFFDHLFCSKKEDESAEISTILDFPSIAELLVTFLFTTQDRDRDVLHMKLLENLNGNLLDSKSDSEVQHWCLITLINYEVCSKRYDSNHYTVLLSLLKQLFFTSRATSSVLARNMQTKFSNTKCIKWSMCYSWDQVCSQIFSKLPSSVLSELIVNIISDLRKTYFQKIQFAINRDTDCFHLIQCYYSSRDSGGSHITDTKWISDLCMALHQIDHGVFRHQMSVSNAMVQLSFSDVTTWSNMYRKGMHLSKLTSNMLNEVISKDTFPWHDIFDYFVNITEMIHCFFEVDLWWNTHNHSHSISNILSKCLPISDDLEFNHTFIKCLLFSKIFLCRLQFITQCHVDFSSFESALRSFDNDICDAICSYEAILTTRSPVNSQFSSADSVVKSVSTRIQFFMKQTHKLILEDCVTEESEIDRKINLMCLQYAYKGAIITQKEYLKKSLESFSNGPVEESKRLISVSSPLVEDNIPRLSHVLYLSHQNMSSDCVNISAIPAILIDTHRQAGAAPYYTLQIKKEFRTETSTEIVMQEIQTEGDRIIICDPSNAEGEAATLEDNIHPTYASNWSDGHKHALELDESSAASAIVAEVYRLLVYFSHDILKGISSSGESNLFIDDVCEILCYDIHLVNLLNVASTNSDEFQTFNNAKNSLFGLLRGICLKLLTIDPIKQSNKYIICGLKLLINILGNDEAVGHGLWLYHAVKSLEVVSTNIFTISKLIYSNDEKVTLSIYLIQTFTCLLTNVVNTKVVHIASSLLKEVIALIRDNENCNIDSVNLLQDEIVKCLFAVWTVRSATDGSSIVNPVASAAEERMNDETSCDVVGVTLALRVLTNSCFLNDSMNEVTASSVDIGYNHDIIEIVAARALEVYFRKKTRLRASHILQRASIVDYEDKLVTLMISPHVYPVIRICVAKLLDVLKTDVSQSNILQTIHKLNVGEEEKIDLTTSMDSEEELEMTQGRSKLMLLFGEQYFELLERNMSIYANFSKSSLKHKGLQCNCSVLDDNSFDILHQETKNSQSAIMHTFGIDYNFQCKINSTYALRTASKEYKDCAGATAHVDLLGVILLWLLLLQSLDSFSNTVTDSDMEPIRAICGIYLAKSGIANALISSMIDYLIEDSKKSSSNTLSGAFNQLDPMLSFAGTESSGLSTLVSYALYRSVCCVPAMIRSFWNDQCSRQQRQILERFIEDRVSSSLIQREIALVTLGQQCGRWNLDELKIRCSAVSREMTAVYVADEVVIELTIRLSPLYPLCNVEVECSKKMGISQSRWRQWTLQIIQLLAQQDGCILDAILLWKKNVDKEFAGVEPCPICYSILHPKTYQMPGLACPTCKNKFHSSCLHKWFQSSGKSKCVLCQQPFF